MKRLAARIGSLGRPRLPPSPGPEFLHRFQRRAIGNTREYSENWSGAVVLPPDEKTRFYTIGATWTVPNLMPPPEAAILPNPDALPRKLDYEPGSYYASIWVGIDGNSNDQVLQVGTFQRVTVANDGSISATSKAFYQWYPDCQQVIDEVNVCPGDLVSCKVIASKETNSAEIYFSNLSRGVKKSCLVEPPANINVTGSSAEWIVERPSAPEDLEIQILANYGGHIFYGGGASSLDAKGTSADYSLANSILIDMRDPDMKLISEAFAVSEDATRTRYRQIGP
jgi:hypothetical protein